MSIKKSRLHCSLIGLFSLDAATCCKNCFSVLAAEYERVASVLKISTPLKDKVDSCLDNCKGICKDWHVLCI